MHQNAYLCIHNSDIDCVDTRAIAVQLNCIVYRSGNLQIAAHPLSAPNLPLRFTLVDKPGLALAKD